MVSVKSFLRPCVAVGGRRSCSGTLLGRQRPTNQPLRGHHTVRGEFSLTLKGNVFAPVADGCGFDSRSSQVLSLLLLSTFETSPMPLSYLHLNYKAIRVQKMIWKARKSIVSSNADDKHTILSVSISWSMEVMIVEPNSRYYAMPSVQRRFQYAS